MSKKQLKLNLDLIENKSLLNLKIFIIIGLFLLGTIVFSTMLTSKVEKRIRELSMHSLEATHQTTLEGLNLWKDALSGTVLEISKNSLIVEYTNELLRLNESEIDLQNSPYQEKIREIVKPFISGQGLRDFFIISPSKTSISSMRDVNIGNKNIIAIKHPGTLEKAFNGSLIITPPAPSIVPLKNRINELEVGYPTMFICAPIRNKDGEVIAVLTLRANPVNSLTRICKASRIGKSGESYIFDTKGMLLTESRFYDQLVRSNLIDSGKSEVFNLLLSDPGVNLIKKPKEESQIDTVFTHAVSHAILGNSGSSIKGYRDYRGVPVLGTWSYDSLLQVGIASEIDEAEVIQSYIIIRSMVYFFIAFLILFSLLFMLLIYMLKARSEKELTILFNAIKSSYVAVSITDNKGVYIYVNQAFTKMFGYSMEDLEGQTPRIIQSEFTTQTTRSEMKKAMQEGTVWIGDVADRCKDGSTLWATLTINPIKDADGTITHFVGLLQDNTLHREMLQDLKDSKMELESANRLKDEFLANVNHEMRTPLNVISGMVPLLKENCSSCTYGSAFDKIEIAAYNMEKIIKQMLDFSHLNSGLLEINNGSFSPALIIDRLHNEFTDKAQKKGLILSLFGARDLPPFVIGDYEKVIDIVFALVDNAIKFSNKGVTSIEVQHDLIDSDHTKLIIHVRDSGPGIGADKLEDIFKPFIQLNGASTREQGGTGLGLSYCKEAARLLNGDILVESVVGNGTTFTFYCVVEIDKQVHKEEIGISESQAGDAALQINEETKSIKGVLSNDEDFAKLLHLMEEGDSEAIELALQISNTIGHNKEFARVISLIEAYDFDGALELCKELLA